MKKEEIAQSNEENLEDLFQKLEETMNELESGEISLEKSFELYHNGMKMVKRCKDKIHTIEKKVQLLGENGELNEF